MKKKTRGAWLIHHAKKLQQMQITSDFDNIDLAGKCGIFLSNLAASDEQLDLNREKVDAVRISSNLKKTEIDTIKRMLHEAKLIDIAGDGSLSVLAVTSASVLEHSSDIFKGCNPTNFEEASIVLADNISDMPKGEKAAAEYIGDTFSLSNAEVSDLFDQSTNNGFVDVETLDTKERFFFNGNLFRKDSVNKTNAILSSLTVDERNKLNKFDQLLTEKACVPVTKARELLGQPLLDKFHAIGMYDFNEVSNNDETVTFLTRPSAFSKFGNPFEEDALDLAKAFVSSLFYGMNFSSPDRGQITMLTALMRKLVRGEWVGPATAIGQDYNILITRQVVQVRSAGFGNRYYMRLLKKDVGELAIQVLESGDAMEKSIASASLGSKTMTSYSGPEQLRTNNRKKQNQQSRTGVANLIRTFRG